MDSIIAIFTFHIPCRLIGGMTGNWAVCGVYSDMG